MTQSVTTQRRNPILITGLSGAGLSSALKAMEDMGYEVFDNFPITMIDSLLQETPMEFAPIAIGMDTRGRGFDPATLLALRDRLSTQLVFLSCEETILQKRFTETRRRHPVAKDRPVSAGIKREQEWLHPLRAQADLVIDTTELSIHGLRHVLEKQFNTVRNAHLTISMTSFGFRFGVPRDADLVMDVRFLANPHWVPDLRPQTGLDAPVGAYVANDPDFAPFLEHFKALIQPLLPRYMHEGKHYLTIALGCTGGKHRSVYTVECLAPWLRELGFTTSVTHRDIGRS